MLRVKTPDSFDGIATPIERSIFFYGIKTPRLSSIFIVELRLRVETPKPEP